MEEDLEAVVEAAFESVAFAVVDKDVACVYIIFKYGKRLRFASSFNDCLSYLIPFRLRCYRF